MTDSDTKTLLPVWALGTEDTEVSAFADDRPLTPERLADLRGALAVMADQPIATLEAHPLPATLDRGHGIPLSAASPLAQHLSQLISRSATRTPAVLDGGELLYRMVIPAKVAREVGQGLVRPMAAKGVAGGVRGALVNSNGIAAQAAFVPAKAASVGAAGGAGAAGAAALGGTALTIAAPLVLMAVAVGASAHADHQRQKAIERITDLLEQIKDDDLDDERSDLEGCRDAVEKATGVLLDKGKLGVSLGLDSAVHAIGKSLAAAERRLKRWESDLDRFPRSGPVELDVVTDAFAGIEEGGGVFRAHLELANLAVALKRRVLVLQAVEHVQGDPGNPFTNFSRALREDQGRVDDVELRMGRVLTRLANLELTRPASRRPAFTANQVEKLMSATNVIRRLGNGVAGDASTRDVEIGIVRSEDGSVLVLPAATV